MKQLGLAVAQYTQDYDEALVSGTNGYGGGSGWAGQLYVYVKSKQVFHCPDDSTTPGTTASGKPAAPSSYAINSNFSYGTAYSGCTGPHGFYTLAQLNAPAKTVMLFEVAGSQNYDITTEDDAGNADNTLGGCGGSPAGNAWGQLTYNLPAISGYGTPTIAIGYPANVDVATQVIGGTATYGNQQFGRHQSGANYMFADGHAKWLRPSAVSVGPNNYTDTGNQAYQGGNPIAAGTSGKLSNGSDPAATFSLI